MTDVPGYPPIRWGILGAGRVARDFAEGLRSLPDARLVAVTSRTAATMSSFQSVHRAERTHGRMDDFLDDDAIDIVYVATPHHRHADDALACIARGRPVVCEKPFTLDAAQARHVVAAARRSGVFCMEAMWTRWIPTIVRLRSLIASGAIGEVRMVTADFSVPAPVDPHHRLFDPAQGGGALLDRGVYGLSFVSMLLGRPERVTSSATIGATGVDEDVAVILSYPQALGVVTASLRGTGSNGATVVGSQATIHVPAPFYVPERLTVVSSRVPSEDQADDLRDRLRAAAKSSRLVRQLHGYIKPLLSLRSTEVRALSGNGYNYEAAEAQRCFRNGWLETPDLPLDETVQVMETLDRARSAWVEP